MWNKGLLNINRKRQNRSVQKGIPEGKLCIKNKKQIFFKLLTGLKKNAEGLAVVKKNSFYRISPGPEQKLIPE